MKAETVKRLLDEGMSIRQLEETLRIDRLLQDRIRRWKVSIEEADKTHLEKLREAGLFQQSIQRDCPHHETITHNDPSGNHDTRYECALCGKQADRLEQLGGVHVKPAPVEPPTGSKEINAAATNQIRGE